MQKRTIPSPQTQYPPPPGTQPVTRPGPSAVTYHIPVSPSVSRTTISLPCHSTWTSGLHFHTQHTEYLHLVRGSIFVYLDGQTRILSAAAGGAVSVYGGNKTKDSGEPGLVIQIPKYARHNWGRAREYLASHRPSCVRPRYPLDIDEEVVVEEWTDPADGGKALFFWNLNGIVMQKQYSGALPPLQHLARWVLGRWWVEFQLWNVFWELDNWPVVLGLRGVFGEGWYGWPLPLGVYLRVRDRLPELLWVERGKRKVERWVEWLVTLVLLGLARGVGWIVGVRAVEKERTPVALWEEYQRKRHSG